MNFHADDGFIFELYTCAVNLQCIVIYRTFMNYAKFIVMEILRCIFSCVVWKYIRVGCDAPCTSFLRKKGELDAPVHDCVLWITGHPPTIIYVTPASTPKLYYNVF